MDLMDRFLAIALEFKERPQSELRSYLDMASEQVTNASLSQIQRDTLIVYLAAHMATSNLKNFKASGAISSVTTGKMSVNYNTVATKDDFDTSHYGTKYKLLCRKYIRYIPQTIWI
jgi:hypothetical protein